MSYNVIMNNFGYKHKAITKSCLDTKTMLISKEQTHFFKQSLHYNSKFGVKIKSCI